MFIFYALFYLSDSLNNKHVSFTFLPSPVSFTGTSWLLTKQEWSNHSGERFSRVLNVFSTNWKFKELWFKKKKKPSPLWKYFHEKQMLYRDIFITLVCCSAHICMHSCVRTYYLPLSTPSKRASSRHFQCVRLPKAELFPAAAAAAAAGGSGLLREIRETDAEYADSVALIKTVARLCRVDFSQLGASAGAHRYEPHGRNSKESELLP